MGIVPGQKEQLTSAISVKFLLYFWGAEHGFVGEGGAGTEVAAHPEAIRQHPALPGCFLKAPTASAGDCHQRAARPQRISPWNHTTIQIGNDQ